MDEVLNKKKAVQTPEKRIISAGRFFRFFVFCTFSLVFISTFLSFLKFQILISNKNLVNIGLTFFSVNREGNIPTYFSSFILLICAILPAFIFFLKRKNHLTEKIYWGLLAFLFLLLSLDEFIGFHELTIDPLRNSLNLSGWLSYGWVVPAIFIVVILGVVFIKFLFMLSAQIRIQFIIAGAIYIGGALGFELIGGYLSETKGVNNFTYALSTNMEEMLEMLGASFFAYSLLNYIQLIRPMGFYIGIKN